jgi:ComF family protein
MEHDGELRASTGTASAMARRVAVSAWHSVMEFLFPSQCLACGTLVSRHGALCPACWTHVRFIERPVCAVLGLPFAHGVDEGMVSPRAMAQAPVFNRNRSAVLYDDIARGMVHRLKYNDRADLAPMMAAWMVRASDGILDDCDLILAVPLHRRRLFSRRYNQSAELARAVARLSGKTMGVNLLRRARATRQQVGLGAKARRDNVRGAFTVRDADKAMIAGRAIVLVDDVYTTGATVDAASRALLRAGARRVSVLTFALVSHEEGDIAQTPG